jgi:Zn-dependent peptidase ImmA (M78 family)
MKKPRTGQPRRKKRPSMRFRLDGEWWTVKVQRPPDKEKLDGMCHYRKKIIYLNPTAVAGDLLGVVAHEITHAVIPPTDETHVLDNERLICCVVRWAAKNFNDGKISIGRHRADR